jgi:hypothetical protein
MDDREVGVRVPVGSIILPVTVAEQSKARNVFPRSDAMIVGSNPIYGMDVWCVCVRLFYVCVVLCLGRGLETGRSLVQVLPILNRSKEK